MKLKLKSLENVKNILTLFFLINSFIPLIEKGIVNSKLETMKNIYIILIFLSTFIYFYRIKVKWNYNIFIFILNIYIIISSFWSSNFNNSFGKSILLLFISFYAFYLRKRYSSIEIISLFNKAIIITVILSYFFIFLVPEIGIFQDYRYGGTWRGVFNHRNSLGRIMSIGFNSLVLEYLATKEKKIIMFSLLCLLLVIGSKSTTSLIILILGIILIFKEKIKPIKNQVKYFYTYLVISVLLFSTTNIFSYLIKNFTNRDVTLTGRTYLWDYGINLFKENIVKGYGYLGLWYENSIYWIRMVKKVGFVAAHIHNGLLEILLQLGLIGFILYFFAVSFGIRKNNRNIKNYNMIFILFLLTLTFNLSESMTFGYNSIFWLIALIAIV